MPLTTTCPECDKNYTLADTMKGKTVKCKSCGNPFTVKATSNSGAVTARPSNGKPTAAATATKNGRPGVTRGDDEDEEEGVRKPPKKKGGLGIWLLAGGGLVAVMMLFVCGGGGIGAYFLFFRTNSVTKANFDKIKGGMSPAQVQEILGKPDKSEDPKDLAAFGIKAGNLPKTSIWESGKNSITVTYSDDKAIAWVGKFDGAEYAMLADASTLMAGFNPSKPNPNPDPKPNPNPDPKSNPDPKPNLDPKPRPTSLITFDNFNKIRGGMNPGDVTGILGISTQGSVKPDALAAQLVSDRGSSQTWSSGSDSITVSFTPDFKAAYWTANIDGQPQTKSDPNYAVKTPTITAAISKDNYNKIKGGETEQEIKNLLNGAKLNANTGATDGESANYEKPHIDTWSDSHGTITVTFCNGRAAHWTGLIDGMPMETKTNQTFVVLKNNNPNPNPNGSKLNQALYNMIVVNQTMYATLVQTLGPPQRLSAIGAGTRNVRAVYTWVDGETQISIHVNPANGVITEKSEKNLK
jgi:hypothetical protein